MAAAAVVWAVVVAVVAVVAAVAVVVAMESVGSAPALAAVTMAVKTAVKTAGMNGVGGWWPAGACCWCSKQWNQAAAPAPLAELGHLDLLHAELLGHLVNVRIGQVEGNVQRRLHPEIVQVVLETFH